MKFKSDYNFTFHQALDIILNDGAWVKGDQFNPGIVMRVDKNGVVIIDMFKHGKFNLILSKNIVEQMYKIIYTEAGSKRV